MPCRVGRLYPGGNVPLSLRHRPGPQAPSHLTQTLAHSRESDLSKPMYPAVADSRTRRHHPFFRPTQTLAVADSRTRRAPRPARHPPHPVTRLRSCSVRSAVRSSRAVRRTLWTRSGGWRRWTWRRWSARCRTRAISSTSASTQPPPLPSGPCVVVALCERSFVADVALSCLGDIAHAGCTGKLLSTRP